MLNILVGSNIWIHYFGIGSHCHTDTPLPLLPYFVPVRDYLMTCITTEELSLTFYLWEHKVKWKVMCRAFVTKQTI